MSTIIRRGVGFFIIGVAVFSIGLAMERPVFTILGLAFVAFALASARKSKTQ